MHRNRFLQKVADFFLHQISLVTCCWQLYRNSTNLSLKVFLKTSNKNKIDMYLQNCTVWSKVHKVHNNIGKKRFEHVRCDVPASYFSRQDRYSYQNVMVCSFSSLSSKTITSLTSEAVIKRLSHVGKIDSTISMMHRSRKEC